jgi:hypothetical protein
MKLETRAVLAAAYETGGRRITSETSMLTHAVELDSAGEAFRVLCRRVKFDNLADRFALDKHKRESPPTCKTCRRRWFQSYTLQE